MMRLFGASETLPPRTIPVSRTMRSQSDRHRFRRLPQATRAALLIIAAAVPLPLPAAAPVAGVTTDAKAALEKLGLAVSGSQVVLAEDVEFGRLLAKSKDLKAVLGKVQNELRVHDKAMKSGSEQLDRLRAEAVRLNAELANVRPGDVTGNNRLVGQLNALAGQITLMSEQRDKAIEAGRKIRGTLNESREEFVQHVLDLRQKADAVEASYAAKQGDAAIKAAVDAYGEALGKEVSFGPGSAFKTGLKRLKSMEDAILSEDIRLEREGNTLLVSVAINGDKIERMVVDSGCSTMLIPHRYADKFEVQAFSGDPSVDCVLADGRTVKGVAKKLRSVRVGKFTVDDVECVVLGPDAPKAELLLGMSFLGNFEFKINADAGLLTMVKVDDGKSQ